MATGGEQAQEMEVPTLVLEVLSPGSIVQSVAGRDSGNLYLVIAQLDDRFVLIVDGQTRRVANPKKKNIKHLKLLGSLEKEQCSVLSDPKKIADAAIRQFLQAFCEKKEVDASACPNRM